MPDTRTHGIDAETRTFGEHAARRGDVAHLLIQPLTIAIHPPLVDGSFVEPSGIEIRSKRIHLGITVVRHVNNLWECTTRAAGLARAHRAHDATSHDTTALERLENEKPARPRAWTR